MALAQNGTHYYADDGPEQNMKLRITKNPTIIVVTLVAAIIISACGGKQEPDTTEADINRKGLSQYDQKQYQSAVFSFTDQLNRYPDGALAASAYYHRGKALYWLADYPMAREDFQTVLTKFSNNRYQDNSQYWLGRTYHQQGDYPRARTEYQLAIDNYPDSTWKDNASLQIGMTYYDAGQFDQARIQLQNTINQYLDPIDAQLGEYNSADLAQYYIAKSFQEQLPANTEQARAQFNILISTYSQSSWRDEAQLQIGKTYYEAGDYNNAKPAFNLVISDYPTENSVDDARYFIARSTHRQALLQQDVLIAEAELANARTEYQHLIDSDRNSSWADNAQYQMGKTHYDLFLANSNTTELQSAIVEFRKVHGFADNSAEDDARYFTGRSYQHLGNAPQARTEFLTLMNLQDSNWADNGHYRIAQTYYDARQWQDAASELESYFLRQNSANPYADNSADDEAHYYLGRSYHQLADPLNPADPLIDQAYAQYQQIPATSTLYDNAQFRLAMTLHLKQDCSAELTLLEQYLSQYPGGFHQNEAQSHVDQINGQDPTHPCTP